jgi:hypothetical protein
LHYGVSVLCLAPHLRCLEAAKDAK